MANIIIKDGYKDAVSGNNYNHPVDGDMAYRMQFEMKEGQSTFSTGAFTSSIIAVDTGLNEPLQKNQTQSPRTCGEIVTIFLKSSNSFSTGTEIQSNSIGDFLSQVKTQFQPFPNWIRINPISIGYNMQIMSEDFTAPNGIFQDIDSYPTFHNSTFKIGPRIWESLDQAVVFPQQRFVNNYYYDPFNNCPNLEKIEYQGDFGDMIERIDPANFTFTDENGYDNPSAHPSGGAPKYINNYCKVKNYNPGLGYNFPNFDTSRLVFAEKPFIIEKLSIGYSYGQVQFPIGGLDFRGANNLEHLTLTIPEVQISDQVYDDQYMFGMKLLGIDGINDNIVSVSGDTYSLRSRQNGTAEEGITPDRLEAGYILTPRFVKTEISFNYGQALETYYTDPFEPLLAPNTPTGTQLISIEDYYKRYLDGEKRVVMVHETSDGTHHGFDIPRLPEGVVQTTSYLENAYRAMAFGSNIPIRLKTNEPQPIESTLTNSVIIKRKPNSVKTTYNHLKGTMSYTMGDTGVITITNPVRRELNGIYGTLGEKPQDQEELRMKAVINMTSNFSEYADNWSKRQKNDGNDFVTKGFDYSNDQMIIRPSNSDDFSEFLDNIYGDPTQRVTQEMNLYRITNSVVLEEDNSTNHLYAINFMDSTWLGSRVDPTVLQTLLALPPVTKTENAYRKALFLELPKVSSPVIVTSWETNKHGLIDNKMYEQFFAIVGRDASVATVSSDQLDEMSYQIENVLTPTGFILTNEEGSHYSKMETAFSSAFKGDINAWINSHGAYVQEDPSVDLLAYYTNRTSPKRYYDDINGEPNYGAYNTFSSSEIVKENVEIGSPGDGNYELVSVAFKPIITKGDVRQANSGSPFGIPESSFIRGVDFQLPYSPTITAMNQVFDITTTSDVINFKNSVGMIELSPLGE